MALMPLVILTPILLSTRGHPQDIPALPQPYHRLATACGLEILFEFPDPAPFLYLLTWCVLTNKKKNLALIIYKYPQLDVRISRRLHWSASSGFPLKFIDIFSSNEVLTVLYLKQMWTPLRKRWHFKTEFWQAVKEKQHKSRLAHLSS